MSNSTSDPTSLITLRERTELLAFTDDDKYECLEHANGEEDKDW